MLDLGCQTIANPITGKTLEEIRKTFNIENNLNYDNDEEIHRKNQMGFE